MTTTPEMPQPGDVLLFAHATGWNRLITFLTRSLYYHVAIYEGDFHVVEARPQGVVSRDLRGPEGTHFCAIIPNPDGRGLDALAWAQSQLGGKYDRWDVLVILLEHVFVHLHLNYAPPGRFSCGEFVARAFQEAGARLFPDRDAADIVPGDFAPLLPPGAKPHNLV
ncbi:MAG: hypothetical protein M3Y13_04275 [Armatimonadota bacterium]|nr:hypothetical protein [Armatimonadota bacterium]